MKELNALLNRVSEVPVQMVETLRLLFCSQRESALKVTNFINSFSLKLLLLIREIIQKCQPSNTRCDITSGNCMYHLLQH